LRARCCGQTWTTPRGPAERNDWRAVCQHATWLLLLTPGQRYHKDMADQATASAAPTAVGMPARRHSFTLTAARVSAAHSRLPPACGCSMRGQFEEVIRKAQDEICAAVEAVDGCKFKEDAWVRPGGGGGISRVLQARLQGVRGSTNLFSGVHLASCRLRAALGQWRRQHGGGDGGSNGVGVGSGATAPGSCGGACLGAWQPADSGQASSGCPARQRS
jgi:Coproporphyrinogen III oxidase